MTSAERQIILNSIGKCAHLIGECLDHLDSIIKMIEKNDKDEQYQKKISSTLKLFSEDGSIISDDDVTLTNEDE